MACERYEDALTEAAAGAPPAAGLESHLAVCARCRQELEELRRTLALVDSDLRQLVAVEPSPELAVRIRRAAAEAGPQATSRPVWLWPALAAAAALMLAVAFLARREPSQTQVATAESRVPQPTTSPESANKIPSAPEGPRAVTARPVPPDHARAADTRRPVAPSEPEIIVPPGEAEALLRLVARLNRERLAAPVMGAAGQPSPDLAEPGSVEIGSIDIQPLEIVPLDPAESAGT
jgi:hypothetical protein